MLILKSVPGQTTEYILLSPMGNITARERVNCDKVENPAQYIQSLWAAYVAKDYDIWCRVGGASNV